LPGPIGRLAQSATEQGHAEQRHQEQEEKAGQSTESPAPRPRLRHGHSLIERIGLLVVIAIQRATLRRRDQRQQWLQGRQRLGPFPRVGAHGVGHQLPLAERSLAGFARREVRFDLSALSLGQDAGDQDGEDEMEIPLHPLHVAGEEDEIRVIVVEIEVHQGVNRL